jgi:hypothetical protein
MHRCRHLIAGLALAAAGCTFAAAAVPPDAVHYQGVLRGQDDEPLDGSYEMTFRFYDDATVDGSLLVDSHLAANGQAIVVSGGLFEVALGTGSVSDGLAPGVYSSLFDVFAAHADVWLEIEVDGEVLRPRLPVRATPWALNAGALGGRAAESFLDTGAGEQTKAGALVVDTRAAAGSTSFRGYGDETGGMFTNNSPETSVRLAHGSYGIVAQGSFAGGDFYSDDWGVRSRGGFGGGKFESSADDAFAHLAHRGYGVHAQGAIDESAGYFTRPDSLSYAYLALPNGFGLEAFGESGGGRFTGTGNALANVAQEGAGISAQGNWAGGEFRDANASGYATVGYGDQGVYGRGSLRGGYFYDSDSGVYGISASGSSSTAGNGTKNFVQNHPYEPDQVIVYAAPEGNEVATYTRGSGRLRDGTAVVRLDETFAWVTNPDLGLTAHVTPRGGAAELWVESITTREIVVRGTPRDAAFDYIAWGLRIGFEEVPIVQEKLADAPLPEMSGNERMLAHHPEWRQHVPPPAFARCRSRRSARASAT